MCDLTYTRYKIYEKFFFSKKFFFANGNQKSYNIGHVQLYRIIS